MKLEEGKPSWQGASLQGAKGETKTRGREEDGDENRKDNCRQGG